jgi:hypothetical protein
MDFRQTRRRYRPDQEESKTALKIYWKGGPKGWTDGGVGVAEAQDERAGWTRQKVAFSLKKHVSMCATGRLVGSFIILFLCFPKK